MEFKNYNCEDNFKKECYQIIDLLEKSGFNRNSFESLYTYELYNTLEHLAWILIGRKPVIFSDFSYYSEVKQKVLNEIKKDTDKYVNILVTTAVAGARLFEFLPYSYNIFTSKYREFMPHYRDYSGYVLENTWLSTSIFATIWQDMRLDVKNVEKDFGGQLVYPILCAQSNFGKAVLNETYNNDRVLKGKPEKTGKRGRHKIEKAKKRKQGNGSSVNSEITFFVESKYNDMKKPYNARVFKTGLVQVIGVIHNDRSDFVDVVTQLHSYLHRRGFTKSPLNVDYNVMYSRNIVSNLVQPFKVPLETYSRGTALLDNQKEITFKFNIANLNKFIKVIYDHKDNTDIAEVVGINEQSDNKAVVKFTNIYKKNSNFFAKSKPITMKIFQYKINYIGTYSKEQVIYIHKWLNRICILYFRDLIVTELNDVKFKQHYKSISNVNNFIKFINEHYVIDNDSSSDED
jgi:hypothetical protein